MFERLLSLGRYKRMRTKTLKATARSLKLLTQHTRGYTHPINNKSEDEVKLEELKKIAEVHGAFGEYRPSYNIHYGRALHDLAKHYGTMGDYTNSKKIFEETLTIFENCGGKMNEDVGIVCSNLAGVHYRLDNIEKSTELYERALSILEDIYGKNNKTNSHIISIRQKLARNYYSNNIPSTWKNGQHFYALRREEFKSHEKACEQAADKNHQYFDFPPRFYNL